MTQSTDIYADLQAALPEGGVLGVLDLLANELREQKKYAELFEARKMQVRQQLGLPVDFHDAGNELDETMGRQLEDGLLAACREVGMLMLAAGRIREGWLYMRPVGDRAVVARALAEIEVDEENADEMIEVALHEGVDVEQGYRLVLQYYGTCHAITTLESFAHQLPRADQQRVAAILIEHLHSELLANLRADIARQEDKQPAETTLQALVHDRDWLFGQMSYHVDTTHLASAVRAARILRDEPSLRLAIDLTEYGRRLHDSFQIPGDEPFEEFYPSHALFFRGSLGEDVEAATNFFRGKAQSIESGPQGTLVLEVYIELLARLGRYDEAIHAATTMLPDGAQWLGFAPSLLELGKRAGDTQAVRDYCRQRDDLLGFATALVLQK